MSFKRDLNPIFASIQLKKTTDPVDVLKLRFLEKRRTIPYEKFDFLLDMHSLGNDMVKPTSNSARRNMCFLSIESSKEFSFAQSIAIFWACQVDRCY